VGLIWAITSPSTFDGGVAEMVSRRVAVLSMMGLGLMVPFVLGADAKVEGDLKKLQGEWISKDPQGGESIWSFKGDKLSLKVPGREYSIVIKLDEKSKPEKNMDFDVADDSPNAKGFKAPGIYKFDGETKVTIAFGADGKDRPTEYKTDFTKSFSFDLVKK
jgi:uncharacterized protein (TIGR03067 family)